MQPEKDREALSFFFLYWGYQNTDTHTHICVLQIEISITKRIMGYKPFLYTTTIATKKKSKQNNYN